MFPDGDVFRIDRHPNDHVGFGRGEHVCLGAHLAQLEIPSAFEEPRSRLVRAKVAGPVERVRASFVGGIKRVPLAWEVSAARVTKRDPLRGASPRLASLLSLETDLGAQT